MEDEVVSGRFTWTGAPGGSAQIHTRGQQGWEQFLFPKCLLKPEVREVVLKVPVALLYLLPLCEFQVGICSRPWQIQPCRGRKKARRGCPQKAQLGKDAGLQSRVSCWGQPGEAPVPGSTQFGPGFWMANLRDQPRCCLLLTKRTNSGATVLSLCRGFAPISKMLNLWFSSLLKQKIKAKDHRVKTADIFSESWKVGNERGLLWLERGVCKDCS